MITDLVHKDGIAWYDAPIPRKWHRCKAQTSGTLPTGMYLERCACGATFIMGGWLEKNSRRGTSGRGGNLDK